MRSNSVPLLSLPCQAEGRIPLAKDAAFTLRSRSCRSCRRRSGGGSCGSHLDSQPVYLRCKAMYLNPQRLHLRCKPLHLDSQPVHLRCKPLHLNPQPVHLRCKPVYLNSQPVHLRCKPLHLNSQPVYLRYKPLYLVPPRQKRRRRPDLCPHGGQSPDSPPMQAPTVRSRRQAS